MTQASTGQRLNPSHKASSVLPNWLRPATIIVIVLAHIGVFAAFMVVSPPAVVSLDSLTMDLVQEGDFFEAEEVAEAEDTPPPEVVEDPEFALPPPEIMSPDALTLPTKRDDMEKVEKKPRSSKHSKPHKRVKRRRAVMQARPKDAQDPERLKHCVSLMSPQIYDAIPQAQPALGRVMRM